MGVQLRRFPRESYVRRTELLAHDLYTWAGEYRRRFESQGWVTDKSPTRLIAGDRADILVQIADELVKQALALWSMR